MRETTQRMTKNEVAGTHGVCGAMLLNLGLELLNAGPLLRQHSMEAADLALRVA